MRVRNLNEQTPNKYSGAKLLAFWDKFSRQTAYRCFVKGCTNKCSVGGRVQKDNAVDKTWYVIPLCDDCNKKTGQNLDIWDFSRLVPANLDEASGGAPAFDPTHRARVAGSPI